MIRLDKVQLRIKLDIVQPRINKLLKKSEEISWNVFQKYKARKTSERLWDKEDIICMCNLHITERIIKNKKETLKIPYLKWYCLKTHEKWRKTCPKMEKHRVRTEYIKISNINIDPVIHQMESDLKRTNDYVQRKNH